MEKQSWKGREGPELPFFIAYPLTANLLLFTGYALVGMLYFIFVMGLSVSTAFYAVVQILTTIGYGDLPFGNAKAFVAIYVLLGVGIVANIMNDIFTLVLSGAEEQFSKSLERVEELVQTDSDSDASVMSSPRWAKWSNLGHALLTYLALVVIWVVFFVLIESCSCSYGLTTIEGCEADECASTGGSTLSIPDSIYEAVITYSTVGFGDYSPKSFPGRVVGAFLMVFGVLAFGNLVASIAAVIDAYKDSYKKPERVSPEVFHRFLDGDGNGRISKAEFRSYMLLREGKVSEDLFKKIDNLFVSIDRDRNGSLSYDEIHNAERRAQLVHLD